MRINDMEIEIIKNYYHKSTVAEDGITHIIDTSHPYTVYQFGMAKNYFTEDKQEALGEIIKDLKGVILELERLNSKQDEEKRRQKDNGR